MEYGMNWSPLGDTKYKNNAYLTCFSHWSGRFYLLTVCRALSVPLIEHCCSRNMAVMCFSCWLQAPDLLNTVFKWVLNVYSKVTGFMFQDFQFKGISILGLKKRSCEYLRDHNNLEDHYSTRTVTFAFSNSG